MPRSTVKELQEELAELREELKTFKASQRDHILAREHRGEVLDQTPVEIPVGYEKPPTIQELVAQYVEGTLSQAAQEEGYGTFEEENDFEPTDEELLPLSGFEVIEMEPEYPPGEPRADPAPPEGEPVAADSGPPEAPSETEPPPAQPASGV